MIEASKNQLSKCIRCSWLAVQISVQPEELTIYKLSLGRVAGKL